MNYELSGKVYRIDEVQEINERFSKRTFVVHVENERNSDYDDYIMLELHKDRTDLIEAFKLQDSITVNYNIQGRKWVNNDGKELIFNTLVAWRLENPNKNQSPPPANNVPPMPEFKAEDVPPAPEEDDLPF